MAAVARLDVVVREEEFQTDVWPVLKAVRPNWTPDNVHFRKLVGGLMNIVIGCRLKEDEKEEDMVLVKIYGKDTSFVDRDNEILVMRVLHHIGCGEPVYCRFSNGMAYRYNPGECLCQARVQEEHIARAVAKELARIKASTNNWRKILEEIGEAESADAFLTPKSIKDDYMSVFLDKVPETLSDPTKQARLLKEVMDKRALEREADDLHQVVMATCGSAVSLSHLDPEPQNTIYDKDTDRVRFIDWEYGRFFPMAFDIGAFMSSFSIGSVMDEEAYPNKAYQLRWIRWFMEYKYGFEGKDPSQVTEREVEEMHAEGNKLALCYLFVGALWSLGQIENSTIEFDFIGFARDLLKIYQKRKTYAFSLCENKGPL